MKARIVLSMLFLVSSILTATAAYKHAENEPTPQQKEVFARLKQKFPGELLDANFKTLHKLSESSEYLQFLSEAHPPKYLGFLKEGERDISPYKTFLQFVKTALPPKERYFQFFNEQLFYQKPEEIQDDELACIHLIATAHWGTEAARRSESAFRLTRPGIESVLSQPEGIKWLAEKGIVEPTEKLLPKDWTLIISVFITLFSVVVSNQDEDVRWIKTLFEKYGEEDGFLWLTVRDPFLFDRILYVFDDPQGFLKWHHYPNQKKVNLEEK